MSVTTNIGSIVAQPGQQFTLGSVFTITPGSAQSIEVYGLDRVEYTAARNNSEGTLAGNGQTVAYTSSLFSDHEYFNVVFTYNAATGQYVNSTYGNFSNLTFTASTDNYRKEYLSIYTSNGYGYTDAADLNIVARSNFSNPFPATIAGQATPNSVTAVAQTFVGHTWNDNGCWLPACNIASAAGASLPLTADSLNVTAHPAGGEWVVVYDGTTQTNPTVAAAEAVVRPGDVVVIDWTYGGGHITTVVSGYGSQAQVVDNQVTGTNWAHDGSSNDIVITGPHSLASELTSSLDLARPSSIQIYRLDTPIVAQGAATAVAQAGSTPLAGLFSVSDPANRSIAQYQVYDNATVGATASLVVNGTAESAHSAATAIILSGSNLALTSFHSTAASGTDTLMVRANNGNYWGDWQAVQVTIGGAVATPANCVDAFVASDLRNHVTLR